MSSYRSAYENYYKNINNTAKGKKDKNNFLNSGRKVWGVSNSHHYTGMNNNESLTNILIKRVTRELTGATIFLFFFVGLKYIPSEQVRTVHDKCKQILNENFNYNECINTFDTFQIGNFKGEDLKVENLKIQVSNFIEYLQSNSNDSQEN